MYNDLAIDLILNRQKYPKIYNATIVILIIIIIICYISYTYELEFYYINKARFTNGELVIPVNLEDLNYISKSNTLFIDATKYNYHIARISKEIYVDNYYNNYELIYLKVDNLESINNIVYEIKISKGSKKLIKYLKELL